MKIASFALVAAFLATSSAFANTYVKCGKTADIDTFEVTGYELELSSEGADNYSGPVGKNWNMKLHDENSEWLESKKIVAQNYELNGDTVVEIKINYGKSVSGPVGVKYRLIGLYDEQPLLEKYSMGGFVGHRLLEKLQCVTGND